MIGEMAFINYLVTWGLDLQTAITAFIGFQLYKHTKALRTLVEAHQDQIEKHHKMIRGNHQRIKKLEIRRKKSG